MKVYHGTNCEFDTVNLSHSRDKRDFGKGFYTTTIRGQAVSWAEAVYDRYGGAGKFVYEFDFDSDNSLQIKKYDDADKEWLEMISQNRTVGGIRHPFDVVIGPVANDKTNRTIALYLGGAITAEIALELLKYNKLNDQVSFHNEKALSFLKLIGREEYAH